MKWKLPSLDFQNDRQGSHAVETEQSVVSVHDVAEEAVAPEPAVTDESTSADAALPERAEALGERPSDPLDQTLNEPPIPAEVIKAEREAAYSDGFESGRKDGYEAGLEAGRIDSQARITDQIQRLEELLNYLAKPIEEHDNRLEEELVALSVAVARQMVRRELSVEPGEIVPVIREALLALPSSNRDVVVWLHPEDAALVREVLADSADSAAWSIVEDPLLSRAGCRVEAGYSHVDATLETRLQNIASALALRSREND